MSLLFLSAIFITLFVVFILLTKKDKNASDYILLVWLSSAVMALIAFYQIQQKDFSFPSFIAFSIGLPILQCPSLFLYVKYKTSTKQFQLKDSLHYLPTLIITALYFDFYFLSYEQKLAVFQNNAKNYHIANTLKLITIYLSGMVYIPLSVYVIYNYRKRMKNTFSNTDKINFNWLLYLILGISIIWFVVYFIQDDNVIFSFASLYLIWLAYFGTKQVNVFSEIKPSEIQLETTALPKKQEKANSIIATKTPNPELFLISEKIDKAILREKVFQNPELTLDELAEIVQENPILVSNAINQIKGVTFYDLINESRIAEFLVRVQQPENKNLTLLAIAYDCGFNSKSSFNRNFEKMTGKTPKEYIDALEITPHLKNT